MDKFLAAAALAATAIASPAAAQDAHAGHADHVARARFSLDTPVEAIVADEKAKAVLEANLPGITTHEHYEMFKTMSLRQLAGMAPDRLTPEVLAKVDTDLAAMK